jgi:cytochrome c553
MKSTLRKILKWTLRSVAAIIVLLLVAYAVIYFLTERRLNKKYEVDVAHLTIPTDSASIALGEHVVNTRGCRDCHGKDLGGKVMIDDPGLGRVVAANLTSGGSGKDFSTEDWVRAIRHGIGTDHKPLLVMPSKEFYFISDNDLANVIGYIKSLPPVEKNLPDHNLKPLARVLYVAGPLAGLTSAEQIDHTAENTMEQKPAVTAAYGKYLAITCTGCHGEDFKGKEMEIPGMKPSANITSTGNVGKWTEEQFITVLKTGKRPDGVQLDNKDMPWDAMTKNFTEDEIRSIYLFLQTLPESKTLQTSAE